LPPAIAECRTRAGLRGGDERRSAPVVRHPAGSRLSPAAASKPIDPQSTRGVRAAGGKRVPTNGMRLPARAAAVGSPGHVRRDVREVARGG